MRFALALAIAMAPALERDARADTRIEADVSLGFAVPLGSLERGSHLGDTALGAASVQLDGAWFVTRRLAIHAEASYAATIPKLCASASDCEASIGRDVALDAGVRLALLELVRFAPRLDVGIGWEWYATSLSDNGVSSTRAYSGPTFVSLSLGAPLRLSRRFSLGPSFGARAGAFTSATRSTPAWSDSSLDGKTIHAWLRFGLDARLDF